VAPARRCMMSGAEDYEILIIGSGGAGKHLTWNMALAGRRTAVVERKYIGGSCPNIACMPSKKVICRAKANWFARHGAEYGIQTGPVATDMRGVFNRKRKMVEGEVRFHVDRFKVTGAELISGEARFVAPKTVEVQLNDGGRGVIIGERVFLDLGSRSAIPDVPGLVAARPMTHVEALDLDRLPEHLVAVGGGYVGLELAQALRRFGSTVTLIHHGSQIAAAEDPDVAQALVENFTSEGIEVLLETRVRKVEGSSGQKVRIVAEKNHGQQTIEGTDLLVATGRTPNTRGIGLEAAGIELGPRGYVKVQGGLRGQAALHACRLRRFPSGPRQPERGQPHDARPAYTVLHVHRSRTRASRFEQNRSEPPGHRISPGEDAHARGPASRNSRRDARLRQDADRGRKRAHPGIHGVWYRSERNDGGSANGNVGRVALHIAARRDLHSSHGCRGPIPAPGSCPRESDATAGLGPRQNSEADLNNPN